MKAQNILRIRKENKMKLYITRHGQTDGNVNKIMDGIRDIDLNSNGVEQAKQTRDELKDIKFDLIISSPLTRTKHTMEIININNFNVVYDDRIKERDCGEFTGLTFDSLDRDLYWNYNDKTIYQSAESLSHLFNRVYNFLDEIKEKYKDKTILLVTHEGITKVINCYFNGIPEDGNLQTLGLKNCEVKVYDL